MIVTSDVTDKIYAGLIAAQKKIEPLKRDSKNPFFNSSYASLEVVLETIKPILLEHEIAIIQASNSLGPSLINITTRFIHSSGQWVEGSFPIPMVRQDPQAAGSASSYGRRYALKCLMALAEVDDDAQSSSEPEPQHDRTKDSLKPITDSQLKELNHLFTTLGATPEQIQATCRKYSADRTEATEGLMKSEAFRLIPRLRAKLKKQAIDE